MILAIHRRCCRRHHLTILMTIQESAVRDGQDTMNKMNTMDTMDTMDTMNTMNTMDRRCTGEFSRMKAKKKLWFHVRKKNRSQKNVTKNNSCHPQNRQFPLSTMMANIHLGSLFRDVNIASSRL
jgi:hypothetical protein